MGLTGFFKRSASVVLAAGIITTGLILAAPTVSGAATPTTATYAEAPSATPNFILPFYPGSDCTVNNIDQFQYLMYRPLYWFGDGTTPNLDPSLSIGNTPAYSNGDTTVTLDMKNYKWSNGESVTADDVMFWMNMDHAEKANWCGYTPTEMPDNLKNVTASGDTLTFTTTGPVNSYWFTYNELSQITPMPSAWDITSASAAPGSGGCSTAAYGTDDTGCAAVYTFLSNQAGYNASDPNASNNSLSTYATNPLWKVVDGPWTLKSFNADGNITFVPNQSYSGPVKPTLKTFTELPYTSDNAEFNALAAGDVSVGYLPTQDVTKSAPAPGKVGPNNPRLTDFDLDPLYTWSITYFPLNFNSVANNGTAGKVFSQTYFRQSLQSLVDQPLFISKVFKGYANPTYGPVPVVPTNPFASTLEKSNPYPYSPSKAKTLLQSHGWSVVPNGTDSCIKPGTGSGECGAGIPKGTKLTFSVPYATGTEWLTQIMTAEQSAWSSIGIHVSLVPQTFDTVTANATSCSGASCTWSMANWGGGWIFSPDSYPTGETLFGKGSEANYGSYYDAKNESLINATITTGTTLTTWENYLAKQLPVVFEPNPAYTLTEINKKLSGVTPQNVYTTIEPENWRWS
jgi:peptide/nickel transport system substrate-binding protein